jgi:xanthine dehydrogenase YagS FAD-binding subunit
MRQFEYIRPQTVQETIDLLSDQQDGQTRPLAGGTDLLTLMKEEIANPERLLDVKRLSDLPRSISENGDGLSLGALTTLADIEISPLVQERYPLLSIAAAIAATPQLRNMATLGGNLLQRPRCWYYRSPHANCWLKGGDDCPAYDGHNERHALFAGGPCYAVHPSDLAPALLALDATVRLRGSRGERTLPLADFFAPPEEGRRRETVLQSDELVLFHRPATPPARRPKYLPQSDGTKSLGFRPRQRRRRPAP